MLSQEHPLTQHVTSETLPFGNIAVSYNIISGNMILVLDARLLWTVFVSKKVQQRRNTSNVTLIFKAISMVKSGFF